MCVQVGRLLCLGLHSRLNCMPEMPFLGSWLTANESRIHRLVFWNRQHTVQTLFRPILAILHSVCQSYFGADLSVKMSQYIKAPSGWTEHTCLSV